MKTFADGWQKALLNGVLIGTILCYVMLPSFGIATWHRVLPEHTHVLFGASFTHADAVEIPSIAPASFEKTESCPDCVGKQISSGVAHLPDSFGLQVLGIVGLGIVLFVFVPPGLSDRVILFPIFYQPPALLPPDPPPNTRI